MAKEKKTVCVDLDNTLARYDGRKGLDDIGDPFVGAREFTLKLSREGGLTAEQLRENVVTWLDRWEIPYDDVWAGSSKPISSAYVDDRAVPRIPAKTARQPDLGYGFVLRRCRDLVGSDCGIEDDDDDGSKGAD